MRTCRPVALPRCFLIPALGAVLWLFAPAASAANHPAVTGKNADCSSCHADLLAGKSVHSEGEIACAICHAAMPDGNKVSISLTVRKEQLCFACHERTAMQKHWSESKRDCLGCHDAHRSDRGMLLRRDADVPYTDAANRSSAHSGSSR